MYKLDKLKMIYGDTCILTNISEKTVLVETPNNEVTLVGQGWNIKLKSRHYEYLEREGIINIVNKSDWIHRCVSVSEKTGKVMKDVILVRDGLVFCRKSNYKCLTIYNNNGDILQKQYIYSGEIITRIAEIKKEGIAYRIRLLAEDCNSMNRTNIEYIMIYNTSNNIIVTNRVGRIQ